MPRKQVTSIDPATAKDLDDALHVLPLPDGRLEVLSLSLSNRHSLSLSLSLSIYI
jgi:exoribonuclease II